MNIAVIGAGEVGFHLADILSREGHRVSIVDSDPSKSRRLMESLDVQVVVGDGTRAEVLNSAGVSKADLAVVVTDVPAPSVEELVAHCRDRLAAYKCPTLVEVVTELPRNPSGKVLKRVLREPYWAGRDRRIG